MGAESHSAERVARALLDRGSFREAVALLRGAVARDRAEETRCASLLAELVEGRMPAPIQDHPPMTLRLVDEWIRRGMLVEALAVLGGTPMGGDETGREWAELLGELLAPVPADAEPVLAEMHRHLLTGGASVALVVLGERAEREPPLPAWALRRLELLRWMLLDNAVAAERQPELTTGASTLFAIAVRDAVNRGDLAEVLRVARHYHSEHPSDPDPPALAAAVEALLAEVAQSREETKHLPGTLPIFGHTAACMQLRMGNVAHAASAYRKLLNGPAPDSHAVQMLGHVDAVLRAARGEPVIEDTFDTFDGEISDTDTLDHSSSSQLALELCDPDDDWTTETPSASAYAEQLISMGRFDEAEKLFRELAAAFPRDTQWPERLQALDSLRQEASGIVLVRIIRRVD